MIVAALIVFLSSGEANFSLGSLAPVSSPASSGGASTSGSMQMSLDWKSDSCSCRATGSHCWIGRDSGYQESWQFEALRLQRLWFSAAGAVEGSLEFWGPTGIGLSLADTGRFSGKIKFFQVGDGGSEQLSEAFQGVWRLTKGIPSAADSTGSEVAAVFRPDSVWQWGMPADQWAPADSIKHKKRIRWFKSDWLIQWDAQKMAFQVIRPNPRGAGLLFSAFNRRQQCGGNAP